MQSPKLRAKTLFDNDPDLLVVYFTSDDQPFTDRQKAESHTRSRLGGAAICPVYRDEQARRLVREREASQQQQEEKEGAEREFRYFPHLFTRR